jgi:hypothetical protein
MKTKEFGAVNEDIKNLCKKVLPIPKNVDGEPSPAQVVNFPGCCS